MNFWFYFNKCNLLLILYVSLSLYKLLFWSTLSMNIAPTILTRLEKFVAPNLEKDTCYVFFFLSYSHSSLGQSLLSEKNAPWSTYWELKFFRLNDDMKIEILFTSRGSKVNSDQAAFEVGFTSNEWPIIGPNFEPLFSRWDLRPKWNAPWEGS